jgi:rhodanese-related sulfurtransferase
LEAMNSPTVINREDAQKLISEGAQLVEVLPQSAYEQEHLPGAVSIPLTELDRRAPQELDPSRPVVVYCWDFQ